MITRKSFSDIAEIILEGGAIKATKYFSPTEVIKGTRLIYSKHCKKMDNSIVFTFGKPNYAERQFIRDCKKAGESFPIKKIQIKWPKK
jgi:hypothetical protein